MKTKQITNKLEIYEKALKQIAHWGFQSHGYAVEMQMIAENALKKGEESDEAA